MVAEYPVVSLIIPIFARNSNFVKSIESIHIPHGISYEILIYNDGSSVPISSQLESFKYIKNTKIYNSKKRKGISFGLNYLINKAKGIYLVRFDSDDFFIKERLSKQILQISEKQIYSICYSSVIYKISKNRFKKDRYHNQNISLFEFSFHNPIIHPTVIGNKKIFLKYKYKESSKYHLFEDYELFYRMRKDGISFYKYNKPLIIYSLKKKISKSFDQNLENFKKKINRGVKFIFIKKILFRLLNKLFLNYFFYLFSKKQELNIPFIKDKVSIVIPTYNSEKTIAKAIDSVIYQNYKSYEILIIDDGSTDNTIKIIKKFKSDNIKLFRFYNTKRPSVLRNMMIDFSDGEYIAFLDSDDYWLKGKLSKQINFMKKNDYCISATGYKTNLNDIKSYKNRTNISFSELIKNNMIGTSSVIVKKKIFEKFKFVNNSFGQPEDYELWLKILTIYKIGYISKVFHIYKDDPNNSIRYFSKNKIKQNLYIFASMNRYLLLNYKLGLLFQFNLEYFKKFFNIFRSKI